MNQAAKLPHPLTTPLEQIDVSDPRLYEQDAWRPYFARLREEEPVHYLADSAFGPFWSITRFEDIVAVDSNHKDFSSEPTIIIGDLTEDMPFEMFIAMDPPKHDVQRRAVQPVVAPQNLADMEGLIRSRVVDILDNLPVGETFDWVERVSVNLTTQMLATLFDFPFEERHKLTYWSDIAAGSGPEKYVVALGYAGWGEGQLEDEMLANAWLSVTADTDIVFDLPVPNRFDEALGRLGIRLDMLHSEAGHA